MGNLVGRQRACSPECGIAHKREYSLCFLASNTTAILQLMDQGVLETMKRRYRKELIGKILFQGDKNKFDVVEFWKKLTLKDCVYMIGDAWDSLHQHIIQCSWRKLEPYLTKEENKETVVTLPTKDNNVNSESPTFATMFVEIPGCEKCNTAKNNDWLNINQNNQGFQILTDYEIIS